MSVKSSEKIGRRGTPEIIKDCRNVADSLIRNLKDSLRQFYNMGLLVWEARDVGINLRELSEAIDRKGFSPSMLSRSAQFVSFLKQKGGFEEFAKTNQDLTVTGFIQSLPKREKPVEVFATPTKEVKELAEKIEVSTEKLRSSLVTDTLATLGNPNLTIESQRVSTESKALSERLEALERKSPLKPTPIRTFPTVTTPFYRYK